MLENNRRKGLGLNKSGTSFGSSFGSGYGPASFDSCYGSDVENETSVSALPSIKHELWRQNLKLSLDVIVSANGQKLQPDFASDDQAEKDRILPPIRGHDADDSDENIIDFIIESLTDNNRASNSLSCPSGKK